MTTRNKKELKVFGATLQGFARACIDLNIIVGPEAKKIVSNIEINKWYPFKRLRDIESIVIENYKNAGPILEKAGAEMMITWFNFGPGKQIIKGGIDFLKFQTSSQGYSSVVKGPKDIVGAFELVEIDEENRKGLIHSTTPFNKDLERGIIIGGMSAPGDLDYIDVNNDDDRRYFRIEFS